MPLCKCDEINSFPQELIQQASILIMIIRRRFDRLFDLFEKSIDLGLLCINRNLFLVVVSIVTFSDDVVIALGIYVISVIATRVALVLWAIVVEAIELVGVIILLA